jgi:hypothetical protein
VIVYHATLEKFDARDDWALLSTNKPSPNSDFLQVSHLTSANQGARMAMVGFGIHIQADAYMEALTEQTSYPYSLAVQPTHLVVICAQHRLAFAAETFGGDSGAAFMLEKDGSIVGMHIEHLNNAQPLPDKTQNDMPTKGDAAQGASSAAAAASSPRRKRQRPVPQEVDDLKTSVNSIIDSTAGMAIAIAVQYVKSHIDALNEQLAARSSSSSSSSSAAAATSSSSAAATTTSSRTSPGV